MLVAQRPLLGSILLQFSRTVGSEPTDRIAIDSCVPIPPATADRVISAWAPLTRLIPQLANALGASRITRLDSVTCLAPSSVTAAVDTSASPLSRVITNPSSVVGVLTVAGNCTPVAVWVWMVTAGPGDTTCAGVSEQRVQVVDS